MKLKPCLDARNPNAAVAHIICHNAERSLVANVAAQLLILIMHAGPKRTRRNVHIGD